MNRHSAIAAVLAGASLLAAAAPASAATQANTTIGDTNPNILFDDTSGTGRDWRIGSSGADIASVFAINDVTNAKTPFQILTGAPTNSLFINSQGNVGLGTATPGLKLHLSNTNTPGVRLEQTTGGGYTPQTWDVAGNEANFFVRDLTNGSRLPFRIHPGAPTSSIDIAAGGNVGVGTASPQEPLHVKRSDGSAQALIEETSGTAAPRLLTDLVNNGPAQLRFKNTETGATSWRAGNEGTSDFAVKPDGGSPALTVTPAGDATSAGALQQNADPAATENPAGVDAQDVLGKVATLPLRTYEYTGDPANARHLGPSGADFRGAFGLGGSDGAVAPADLGSVSLVAIKALNDRVKDLEARPAGQAATPIPHELEVVPGQIVQLTAADATAAGRIKALETANRKQDRRLKALEKKVRALARKRR